MYDQFSHKVFTFNGRSSNATVIDGKDGSIVGTIDLGGAPEQAQSDGQGHLYVDIEDKNNVVVVDVKTLKVTAPPNGTEAPPGPYMLFVIGSNGVPSIAKMISSFDNPPCNSPSAPNGLMS